MSKSPLSKPLSIGQAAPDFTGFTQNEERISLADFKGKPVVLYFYPKDNTPGCTLESCGFQQALGDFQAADVQVIGVSKDSIRSHKNFATKYDLAFPLIADTEAEICQTYGVLAEKSMFGKKYFGIVRSTFLIDAQGHLAHIWPKVSVSGHVADVLAKVKALN